MQRTVIARLNALQKIKEYREHGKIFEQNIQKSCEGCSIFSSDRWTYLHAAPLKLVDAIVKRSMRSGSSAHSGI